MSSHSLKVSRRKFLRSALALTSGLLAGSLMQINRARAGTREAFGGDSVTVNLDNYDDLKEDGGFAVIKEVRVGDTTDNLIIVRKSEKEYLVFSSICRHKKCNVKYKNDKKLFVCPCHGSTYDLTGQVIKGPSTGNIPEYDVTLSGRKLTVSPKP